MILFILGHHNSPSSSGASMLASSSAFAPSGLLSHGEPWSSSSSVLLVHFVLDSSLRFALAHRNRGNIGHHSCPGLCPCLLLPVPPFVPVTVPVRFAALGALLTSFFSSGHLFCHSPLITSLSSIPRSCSVRSFPACSLAGIIPFPSDRTHVVA